MRHHPISAGLVAILLASATPGLAQEAGDCGTLCRLQDYLSTDHMTVDAGEPPAAAPGKPQHARAAVHKAAPLAKPSRPAPLASATARPAPTPRAAGAPASPPVRPDPAPAKVARAAVAPSPAETALVAPMPVARPAWPAPPAPPPTPVIRRPTPPHVATASALPASLPSRTASLSTVIPGSAPALQAGFH